jgi:hypothetical protein
VLMPCERKATASGRGMWQHNGPMPWRQARQQPVWLCRRGGRPVAVRTCAQHARARLFHRSVCNMFTSLTPCPCCEPLVAPGVTRDMPARGGGSAEAGRAVRSSRASDKMQVAKAPAPSSSLLALAHRGRACTRGQAGRGRCRRGAGPARAPDRGADKHAGAECRVPACSVERGAPGLATRLPTHPARAAAAVQFRQFRRHLGGAAPDRGRAEAPRPAQPR